MFHSKLRSDKGFQHKVKHETWFNLYGNARVRARKFQFIMLTLSFIRLGQGGRKIDKRKNANSTNYLRFLFVLEAGLEPAQP